MILWAACFGDAFARLFGRCLEPLGRGEASGGGVGVPRNLAFVVGVRVLFILCIYVTWVVRVFTRLWLWGRGGDPGVLA